MNLSIDYPETLLDVLQVTHEEFKVQARFAMTAMLHQEGKLSSGQAALLARMGRVAFLLELPRHIVSMSNLPEAELLRDVHVG